MEAYVSVPYTFTPHQREELLHAAEIAGIKIVKLVEEPLAILNSTWRLEQNGQYLLAGKLCEEKHVSFTHKTNFKKKILARTSVLVSCECLTANMTSWAT